MKPIPELHPGDCIKYKKYGHVFNGTIRAIINEYYFRSGYVEKCFLCTHPQGFYNIPVRYCEILGLDVTEQS
jgi:hypothetical protein